MWSVSEWVSNGHLPTAEVVQELVAEAHRRFAPVPDGRVADYIPALAEASPDHFGLCVSSSGGALFEAGEARVAFSIQSISKPFLFALICQAIGEEAAREKLGVNSTGLPFNSVLAVERSGEGLSNPMVNAGAIAATSLAPGASSEEKPRCFHVAMSSSQEQRCLTHPIQAMDVPSGAQRVRFAGVVLERCPAQRATTRPFRPEVRWTRGRPRRERPVRRRWWALRTWSSGPER